jgi:hypothetical protein
MVRYTLENCVLLYINVKCGSAIKCRRNIRRQFRDERAPSRQTIKNLANQLWSTGLLVDKKEKRKYRVLTGKLDYSGARLEHTPRKPLKHLARETAVSTSSTRTATQLLKLRPYKATEIHARLADMRSSWQGSFLQLVLREINPQLTFCYDEEWFHLQGYINMQNNRYWSSKNPRLTNEVPLHPVKVSVWCTVSARIVVSVFFNKKINCERYLLVEGEHFQHLLRSVNCICFIPNVIGRQACWLIGKTSMRLSASGAPVAVKCRVVKPVNKVNILPV